MSEPAVYDKAKWHYEHPEFPRDLAEARGYLFGGFFLAWAYFAGLVAEDELAEATDQFNRLDRRLITPGELYRALDGTLTSETLTDLGNGFAAFSFESEEFDYYSLFERVLAASLPSPYHVQDSWEAFDKLRPNLDAAFRDWRARIAR